MLNEEIFTDANVGPCVLRNVAKSQDLVTEIAMVLNQKESQFEETHRTRNLLMVPSLSRSK